MAIVIPNSQQVPLRNALEEAKAMLPTPAAQKNLARLFRVKLSDEARKIIFGSTYTELKMLTYLIMANG